MCNNKIRLHKFIADSGYCSRRKAELLILENKVKVNDKIIPTLGYKVCLSDIIKINDKIITLNEKTIYILLNKPIGYLCTLNDPLNRNTVMQLLPTHPRVYPVGRLDYRSSGMLILTNDGYIANRIAHPSFKCSKIYQIKINGILTIHKKELLENGVVIDGFFDTGKSLINNIIIKNNTSVFRMTIFQGYNRQIRKMMEKVNCSVLKLHRIQIGDLKLNSELKSGKFIYLKKDYMYKTFDKD